MTNELKNIFFYDKSAKELTSTNVAGYKIEPPQGYTVLLRKEGIGHNLEFALSHASFIVAHIRVSDFNDADKPSPELKEIFTVNSDVKFNFQIVLLLTSDGGYPSKRILYRHTRKLNEHGKTRYIFFARDCSLVKSPDVFEKLLEIDTDTAHKICEGHIGQISINIRDMFFEKSTLFLPALSILCHGFLQLHSNTANTEIMKALEEIGYQKLNPSQKRQLLYDQTLSAKKDRASDPNSLEWWNIFGDYTCSEVIQFAEDEWRGQNLSEWDHVKKFIQDLFCTNRSGPNPEDVALTFIYLFRQGTKP